MKVLRKPCNLCGAFPKDRISVGVGHEKYIDFIHECGFCHRRVTTRLIITEDTKFIHIDEGMELSICAWNDQCGGKT